MRWTRRWMSTMSVVSATSCGPCRAASNSFSLRITRSRWISTRPSSWRPYRAEDPMSELRWILLVVGVVFLIGLTAWESHRSRLARAAARERARALAETIPFGQPLAPGAGSPQDAAAASAIPAWLERPVKDAGPALGELPAATVCDFPLDASEPEEQA